MVAFIVARIYARYYEFTCLKEIQIGQETK